MMGLRDLVREVLAEMPGASSREVAATVAKRTPDDALMDFYTDVLVGFVGQVIAKDRNNAWDKFLHGSDTSDTGAAPVDQPTELVEVTSGNAPTPAPPPAAPPPAASPGLSWRAAEIRAQDWTELLNEELLFKTQKKKIRDCNAAELLSAATHRRGLAAANTARAAAYEALADLLDTYKVEYPRDLPPEAAGKLPDKVRKRL